MTNEDLKNYVFNKYGIKLCNDDADLLTDFFKVVEQDRRKQTSTQLDNIFNEIKWFDINEIYSLIRESCNHVFVPKVAFDSKEEIDAIKYDQESLSRLRMGYACFENNRSFFSKLYRFLFESSLEKQYYKTLMYQCKPVELFKITIHAFANYNDLFADILFQEIKENKLTSNVDYRFCDKDGMFYGMFYNEDRERFIIHSHYNDPEAPYFLVKICAKYIFKYRVQVIEIIHRNPKVTNYTLDIINLICPVIAQKYAGIPALAIVGAITLLFKQGINKYL